MRYDHAIEKLTNVVECLATHPGDVRERLLIAHSLCLGLTTRSFPEHLQSDWEWVMKELTKFGPMTMVDGTNYYGAVENTMKKIRKSTGVKIAKKLYQMYWSLSSNTPYA